MDANKIVAIAAVAVVIAASAGVGIWFVNNNNGDKLDSNVEIKIAYLNLGYYPLMYGFQKGMFDDIGFKVTPVVVSGSGQISVETLLSGGATMAATGDAPFVNAVGKYGDKIVGLTQYSQKEGSMAGHYFIAKNAMKSSLDEVARTDGIQTNGQTVADQIKAITAANQGSYNGMFAVSVNKGSTTHTNFMKWCLQYNLTFTSDSAGHADVYINAIPSATADILEGSLDSFDAVACNKTLYSTITGAIGDKIYTFGDSSPLPDEAAYEVLLTTKENYDKYKNYMMKILEKLKYINEYCTEHLDDMANVCSQLSGEKADSITKSWNGSTHKVVWNTDKLGGWISTAKVNGYTSITVDDFINCCPHRDVINGWYKS